MKKAFAILLCIALALLLLVHFDHDTIIGKYQRTDEGQHILFVDMDWETDAFLLVNKTNDPAIFADLKPGDQIEVTLIRIQSDETMQIAEISDLRIIK